jgi:ferric-dicitrate binding protein FerR (iron transport regulator)
MPIALRTDVLGNYGDYQRQVRLLAGQAFRYFYLD